MDFGFVAAVHIDLLGPPTRVNEHSPCYPVIILWNEGDLVFHAARRRDSTVVDQRKFD